MTELRFPRWLAGVGIFAGMMIALVIPVAVLMLGGDLTPSAKLVVIILALIIGGCVAGASAVVGITIPTAVAGGALKIIENGGVSFGSIADCCQPEVESDQEDACCSPNPSSPAGR
jgi:hypothetical protein